MWQSLQFRISRGILFSSLFPFAFVFSPSYFILYQSSTFLFSLFPMSSFVTFWFTLKIFSILKFVFFSLSTSKFPIQWTNLFNILKCLHWFLFVVCVTCVCGHIYIYIYNMKHLHPHSSLSFKTNKNFHSILNTTRDKDCMYVDHSRKFTYYLPKFSYLSGSGKIFLFLVLILSS